MQTKAKSIKQNWNNDKATSNNKKSIMKQPDQEQL